MYASLKNIGITVLCSVSLALLLSIYFRPDRYWLDIDQILTTTYYWAMAGCIIGLILGWLLDKKDISFGWHYVMTLLIRFGLSFYLISYGISKIEDATFSNSILSLGYRVGDLSSNDIVQLFFGYTYGYQATLGWLEILCAAFLMFRRTFLIGAFILTVYFTNMLLVVYFFENPNFYNVALYLFVSLTLVLTQGQRLFNAFIGRGAIPQMGMRFSQEFPHSYRSVSILKLLFLAGLFTFYLGETRDRLQYTRYNEDSPISGVWKIAGLEYTPQDTFALDSAYTVEREIEKFDRFFLDEGRYGAVKVEDSLSMFEYIIDTNYHQLEFWNFFDFRELDFKGKYQMIGSDTLIYNGMNKKDSLRLVLVLDKEYKPLR